MSLTAGEIGVVTEILTNELKGGRVQKVISPDREDRVVLALRTPGHNHLLQLVLAAQVTRLARIPAKPPAAPSPHPFVMLLRDRLIGMELLAVTQLNGDRVVLLDFRRQDRRGALALELTSRHANLFWLDGDRIIGGSWYPNRSFKRKLVPGEPYLPPAGRPFEPGVKVRFGRYERLEEAIERHYVKREAALVREGEVAYAERLANRAVRQLRRLTTKLDRDLASAERGELLAQQGQLLKANLYQAKKGLTELAVTDFSGQPATIKLDPTLDPVANMERMFAKAKKLRRAVPTIEQRKSAAADQLEQLTLLLDEIPTADQDRLKAVQQQLLRDFPRLGLKPPGKGRPVQGRLPYREFTISPGRTARVGRSATDNDTLTLRHAKPDDLWLHVRELRGSHVVVPLGRGEDPLPETLIDAAHLAARFSGAADESPVEVIYTRRRYVQKPRGAPPGSVRLLREKTLLVRIEQSRLTRILNTK